MPNQVQFEIKGKLYPAPSAFRLVDPVLVEALTGIEWMEWAERLPDEDGLDTAGRPSEDPLVTLGMIGVAVWQANPTWRRDRVLRFVEGLLMEDVKMIGGDEEDDDEIPPAEGAATPEDESLRSAETPREEAA